MDLDALSGNGAVAGHVRCTYFIMADIPPPSFPISVAFLGPTTHVHVYPIYPFAIRYHVFCTAHFTFADSEKRERKRKRRWRRREEAWLCRYFFNECLFEHDTYPPRGNLSFVSPLLQAQCAVGPILMKGRRDNTKPGLCHGPMAWGSCFVQAHLSFSFSGYSRVFRCTFVWSRLTL